MTICYALVLRFRLATLAVLLPTLLAGHPCAVCHAKETEGFAKTAMAHSMQGIGQAAGAQAEGSFQHPASTVQFSIRNTASGTWHSVQKADNSESLQVGYVIGSGSHAFGYIVQVGDHLFQSPLSYYTTRRIWDMAPGYEQSTDPDFSRPVTPECLSCHADQPRPVPNTLNSYQSPPFEGTAIQCDRCHGSAASHLKNPVPGTIVNPAKLPQAARDSVCEQCHLTGEMRIPNPGKAITDFQPGHALEDFYTVYVARQDTRKTVKVVSQAEQLALSVCSTSSKGRLWCGSCHNPHETPIRPAEYYRERCLSCHGATLEKSHAAVGRDCVACHIARRPAKDGGHTAFTDHRISRHPESAGGATLDDELIAWREPDASLRQRNLALTLVTVGMQNHNSNQVIRGYRSLNKLESQFSNDAATVTALGTILLTAKQPAEAIRRFQRALELRPDYAPYEVNLGEALLDKGDAAGATRHLERAVQLDPLLQQAVQLLHQVYLTQGQQPKAEDLLSRYRSAMGFTGKDTK
jgi:hypothetical protein